MTAETGTAQAIQTQQTKIDAVSCKGAPGGSVGSTAGTRGLAEPPDPMRPKRKVPLMDESKSPGTDSIEQPGAPLTWEQIVEHCSRLHTTRRRPLVPLHLFPDCTAMREDSATLDVLIDSTPATVVPTRMHEPGFYVRHTLTHSAGEWSPPGWHLRSDDELAMFERLVRQGRVRLAAAGGTS